MSIIVAMSAHASLRLKAQAHSEDCVGCPGDMTAQSDRLEGQVGVASKRNSEELFEEVQLGP